MILVKNLNQYDDNNIIFCDPIKNNVISDGNFIRILYSTSNFTSNGIYLLIHFNNVNCDKYYNKYKYIFNIESHKQLIEKIRTIEENILRKMETIFNNKIPQYKIYEQFKNGYIKIFQEIQNKSNIDLILKISGIWEINSSFGLTYKFIKINDEA
jgi:hypothetical protein